MKLQFDDATIAFREEFASWLDANAPDVAETVERSRSSADIPEWARRWQRKLFDAGWLVPGNAPDFGGRNATMIEQFVHLEEVTRRRVTLSYNPQALGIIVPSLLAYGTDEQKYQWARPLLRAEITAALGMSEPDAGSDLAALRTRAQLVESKSGSPYFIVNGQKVWTSGAHDADVIFAFVRTDPDAPKHEGISVLLIPTDTPGVTRRPFGSIVASDDLDFNEVFLDDVVVPAENLVGTLNGGWRLATGSLGHERAMLWLVYGDRLDDLVTSGGRALLDEGAGDESRVHDWFGTLVADSYAIRLLGYRSLARIRKGMDTTEQSILKLFGSEAVQTAAMRLVETLGPSALENSVPSRDRAPLGEDFEGGSWFDRYLHSFSGTIAGGTSQIQRNIIAERVLGLPR